MKKEKLTGLLVILLFTGYTISAQDCVFYYPDVEGAKVELTHYDNKDKITGKSEQEVIKIERAGSDVKAVIKNNYFDKKDEFVFENEMEVSCKDGIFYIEMNNYLNEQALAGFKDMEMEIKGDNLQFPPDMKVGDLLDDGTVTMSFNSPAMSMMNMSTIIKNRKVEAIENITTPAGTFKCFKISYDIETDTFMKKVTSKAVQWFSENAGMVRTESYNQSGKLDSYSVLTGIQK
jgi:hypothetical protein